MRIARGSAARLSLLVMMAVLACGDEGKGGLGIDDGAKTGVSVSMLVTRANGATLVLKTGASVNVPPGAMKSDTMLAVERPADARAVELTRSVPRRYRLASAPYVLTPHGSMFDSNVKISLPVGRTVANNKLRVAWVESESDTNWKIMEQPAISGRAASFDVQHFSVMVLVEEEDEGGDVEPGDYRARLLKKFDDCDMISKQGDFNASWLDTIRGKGEECEVECIFNIGCADFISYTEWCGEGSDDAPESLLTCMEECLGFEFEVECLDSDGVQIVADACDGTSDCADASDEKNCPAEALFACTSGERVGADDRCDGGEDCADGSDEDGCPPGTSFLCADGGHVDLESECDGYEDCADGSDEQSCSGRIFMCSDGSERLSINDVCDGWEDCPDGSDEPARCMQFECSAN